MVVLVMSAAVACNRAQTDREAERAADQVKVAAEQAGEKLADGWLTTKIQAQFFVDDDIKSRFINVSSRDGVVKLKGFVESDDARRQVLEITRNTDGVKQIDDRDLLVGRPASQSFEIASAPPPAAPIATTGVTPAPARLDDGTVTSLVQAQFFLDPAIKSRHIEVQTANGVVTLRGQVASDSERGQALGLARAAQGVQRVEDSLTVDASIGQTPAPLAASPNTVDPAGTAQAEASVESALKSKLAADTAVKMAKIDVSARDGVVTLQGTAPTQAAKERALTIAREMDGVTQVVDRISVRPKG
jgi:hyperosmotically inducible protein